MLTLTGIYSVMNTQFSELIIHSHMNAQTMTVYAMSYPPESNSALHGHLDCDGEDRQDHAARSSQSS